MIRKKISAAPSVRRLPSYLNIIRELQTGGNEYVSGTVIAQELKLDPIQVRKDLALTGITGKPKKGYRLPALITAIERYLGWDTPRNAVLVGAGNLGSALMGYAAFNCHGLTIQAAFDINPHLAGTEIHGIRVFPAGSMEAQIRESGTKIAILTVSPASAQAAADALVHAGIDGIWNFTTVKLKVPEDVVVQQEDLSSGLAMLSVMLRAKTRETGKPPA
ncbi:MAG: redox-sensing transcriptional repressor Rex [Spirochaetaceae bacterium]|jgi:redox-sensing transcriptional repressor|nr:redox-sensing transcriptional repressor Rex [Spirochaetaceae bacterium]